MEIERLGVLCTWTSGKPKETSASFAVEEFAITVEGERISLHRDRGWTVGMMYRRVSRKPRYWDHATADSIVSGIYSTLLPEEYREDADDHDWWRLVDILERKGIAATRQELRNLPYFVEFSANLLEMLTAEEAARFPLQVDWSTFE